VYRYNFAEVLTVKPMRIRRTPILFAAILILLLGQLSFSPSPASAQEELDILLMGNSLVRGVKSPLEKMLRAAGYDVKIKAAAPGIRDLQYHADSPRSEKIITAKQWDFVFLQQKSIGLTETDGGYDAVRTLVSKISNADQDAVIMMLMTWRERDVPWQSTLWNQLIEWQHPTTGDTWGYLPIAEELQIGVAPGGWAVREARRGFGDVTEPPVDLWKGGKGRHLSDVGGYLLACVLYTTITGNSPMDAYAPERIGSSMVEYLKGIAHDVVLTNPAAWNLNLPPG